MSAIQNCIDLRLAVSDHVGNRYISDVFPRLVQMAESDLNTRLRTRHQVVDATLSFEDGWASLPPDYMELISVCGDWHPPYQVDGYSMRIPGFSGDLDIQYYGRLPSLTCSPTATNWLLVRYPQVYLYGVGLEAAKHLKDIELAMATDQLYGTALGAVIADDNRARYANRVVRVGGPTP